jgi:hypothetical protein
MTKAALLATALCLGIMPVAFAQDMTSAERSACMGDYQKFCNGTPRGGGKILVCLDKQGAKLSPACRKVVDARKK